MSATALLFPGQGSQQPGMAAAWRQHPAHTRWEEAGDVLGWDVARLGSDATADELRAPRACQVALYTHHAVLFEAWRAAEGTHPIAAAGHSLGEYSALLAAGALDFADGLRLVDARARLTEEAAARSPGGMVACLGIDADTVATAAAETGAHVANDNAPGQIVVAGAAETLERLRDALAGEPGRVVWLEVGAAYHSPHVESAVEPFRAVLRSARFAAPSIPVVTNVDASPHADAEDWPRLLAAQLTAPVRWRESVLTLAAMGVTDVVELGASSVVSGMVKRTAPQLARRAITAPEHLAVGARA
jgi:[acyl-carrier-protein] S-malonyltransferase